MYSLYIYKLFLIIKKYSKGLIMRQSWDVRCYWYTTIGIQLQGT